MAAPQLPIPTLPSIPSIKPAPGLGGGANKFATGNKTYGPGQIGSATAGPVDKIGYLNRDRKRQLRQLAMQNAAIPIATPDTLGSAH